MEELRERYQQLLTAYKRLDYMTKTFVALLKKRVEFESEENELILHRDALIQRFEFCYDLTWKFFKQLLKTKYSIDATSPRKVFQECYQQNILSAQQTEKLLEMIDARNQTSHVYDESMADEISQKIIEYYEFLSTIIKNIQI